MKYSPNKIYQKYIFFEIINKSLLWNISYNIEFINNKYNIGFNITINYNLINIYKTGSLGFSYLILELFYNSNDYNKPELTNISYIPEIKNMDEKTSIIKNICEKLSKLQIKLYNYQFKSLLKMIDIEKGENNTINYSYNLTYNDIDYIIDPISNIIVNNNLKLNIKSKGGILADEMGLGKTITCISLISLDNIEDNISPYKISLKNASNKITSKATLILCPSHLTKQWYNEIFKCNKNLKVIMILTKNDFSKYNFDNIINSDVIIISYQFLMNFKYYPALYYNYNKVIQVDQLELKDFNQNIINEFTGNITACNINIKFRQASIDKYINNVFHNLDYEDIKKLELPLFDFFYFNRFIIDEGHEILGEASNVIQLNKYITNCISNIDSNYYWYVSGTPFSNLKSIENCAKFINLKLEIPDKNIIFDYTNKKNYNNLSLNFLNKEYIWLNIFNSICIRHLKSDIKDEINLIGYDEEIIWLNFTEIEQQLYDSKKTKVNKLYLQQLCCHLLVVESTRKIVGNGEIDLCIIQDKLIDYHNKNYLYYKIQLEKLDTSKPEYYLLKKTYENQIIESNYMITMLDKLKSPDNIKLENCSICLDIISNPILTSCGHLYCYDCIKLSLLQKSLCPICKNNLNGKDLLIINSFSNKINNPLIEKYGSKLGKLILIINNLILNSDFRIIIFSQWDDMLHLISKVLLDNNINNSSVKGNIHIRTSAINKFKNSDTNKIILLSSKNAASGTNLNEATHIIFIDPINDTKEKVKAIESQSIARVCRIGQKHKVKLIRILMKNTVEEDIYNEKYC